MICNDQQFRTPPDQEIDSARLDKLIAAAEAVWTCEHDHQELVVFVKSGGARNFYMQCQRCGENVRHLRGSDLDEEDKQTALPRNEWRRQEWYRQRNEHLLPLYNLRMHAVEYDRRKKYNEYIKSPEWRALRAKVFRRCKGICEGCGENAAVQVHHLTYARLGHEMLFDVVAVCLSCHEQLHPWKKFS